MSQLQVTTLETTSSLSANVITAGETTVNSTGMFLSGSNGVVNTSAIRVISDASNVTLLSVTSTPSINVGGTSYTSLTTESVNSQIFTANGTWIKPSWANTGNELVITHLWGGGGGGYSNTSNYQGGGGGAFVFGYFKSSQCNATCNVVVGLGGSVGNNTSAATTGGTSIFYANTTNSLSAYGGRGGTGAGTGGGGGGWLSAGTGAGGGNPLGGAGGGTGGDSTFGGGGGFTGPPYVGGRSVYGGGGGGTSAGSGGSSIYGGAGGAQSAATSTSVYGGAGGNTTVQAGIPGGGGGVPNSIVGNTFYSGARGEVRVYTLRITG